MITDTQRIKLLKQLLAERILVLDGAFGTFVLGENLTAADYGGARYEGCNENVVRTRPDLIRRMHDGFLEVGADIIETASFQASPIVLAEYGLEPDTREINRLPPAPARGGGGRFPPAGQPRLWRGKRPLVSAPRPSRASSRARWARRPRASRSPAASRSIRCATAT